MGSDALEVRPLSRAQAERVTEKLKGALGDAADLYQQAVEGRAWEAMGYPSFDAWVRAEFEGESRGKVWRLNSTYEVVKALSESAGEFVPVSQREAVAVAKRARQSAGGRDPSAAQVVDAANARARDKSAGRGAPLRVLAEAIAESGDHLPVMAPLHGTAEDIPQWLDAVERPIRARAAAAGVPVREWVVAAVVAGLEGTTVDIVIQRAKVSDMAGESAQKIAAKLGMAKATVQNRQKEAASSERWECCGALKSGPHQRFCSRKG